MGCGGSTEVSSATAVAVEDATTSCVSDTPLVEDIAIDYDLDGEEMDLVELAMFIAKTKRDGVWIRSVNAVNLDGERDKFISALGKCVDLESLDLSENYLGLDQDRGKLTGDVGMRLFVPVLGKFSRLQKLALANNGLRAGGIESLTATVNSLQQLKKLDLDIQRFR